MSDPMKGAIDLSQLGKPAPPPDPEIHDCTVPDGCALRTRGPRAHSDLVDCVNTTVPYVVQFIELRELGIKLAEENQKFDIVNNDLLAANRALVEENDKLKSQVARARGTVRMEEINLPEKDVVL